MTDIRRLFGNQAPKAAQNKKGAAAKASAPAAAAMQKDAFVSPLRALAGKGYDAVSKASSDKDAGKTGAMFLMSIDQQANKKNLAARMGTAALKESLLPDGAARVAKLTLEAIKDGKDQSTQDAARMALKIVQDMSYGQNNYYTTLAMARVIAENSPDATARALAHQAATAIDQKMTIYTNKDLSIKLFEQISKLPEPPSPKIDQALVASFSHDAMASAYSYQDAYELGLSSLRVIERDKNVAAEIGTVSFEEGGVSYDGAIRAQKFALEAIQQGKDKTVKDWAALAERITRGGLASPDTRKMNEGMAWMIGERSGNPLVKSLVEQTRRALFDEERLVYSTLSDQGAREASIALYQHLGALPNAPLTTSTLADGAAKIMDSVTGPGDKYLIAYHAIDSVYDLSNRDNQVCKFVYEIEHGAISFDAANKAMKYSLEAIRDGKDQSTKDQAQLALRLLNEVPAGVDSAKIAQDMALLFLSEA